MEFLNCFNLFFKQIDDINDSEPTSAILDYCKRKFIHPYVYLLGIIGLRPNTVDRPDVVTYLGHIQSSIVLFVLVLGYFLQYTLSFRRDRGFSYNKNNGTLLTHQNHAQNFEELNVAIERYGEILQYGKSIFIFAIPSLLHLLGFLTAIYVFRVAENEQLQSLVERVFMLSSNPRRLVIRLWSFLVLGFVWLAFSTTCVYFLVFRDTIVMRFDFVGFEPENHQLLLRCLLMICVFSHDLILIVIICNYSIQCFLLRRYLSSLKEKLLQNHMEPLDWMRVSCFFIF